MRRTLKILSFSIIVILATSCEKKLESLVTVSPNKTYELRLVESASPTNGKSSLFPSTLKLTFIRHGKIIFENPEFRKLDYPSTGIIMKYPSVSWLSENILRWGMSGSASSVGCEHVRVYNNTGKTITQLFVEGYQENFFILDFASGATVNLCAQSQSFPTHDRSEFWVSCLAEDGNVYLAGGSIFEVSALGNGVARYCIIIHDNKIQIRSLDFVGRDFSDPDSPLPIGKALKCE